jgi:hypothetical protein
MTRRHDRDRLQHMLNHLETSAKLLLAVRRGRSAILMQGARSILIDDRL